MRIDRKNIGARIQKARKALDLTQATVAERAGLDTVYLSQIERGMKLMSVEALFRIAGVLKISPGSVLDGGEMAKDDPLLREVRAVLAKWNMKQQKAILKALRALADL
jgi:transcriptional regulator with XRE-family HTH domain